MVIFWTASGRHTNPLYHARSDSPQSFGNVFGIPALGISGWRPHLTASNTWTQPVQPNVPTPLSRFGQWASSLSSSLPLMLGLILMVQHIQSGYVFQAAGAWRGGMSIFNPDQTCLTRDVKPAHWYCMGLLIKDNSAVCIGHMERLSVSQTGTPRLKLSGAQVVPGTFSVLQSHTLVIPFIPACTSVALQPDGIDGRDYCFCRLRANPI